MNLLNFAQTMVVAALSAAVGVTVGLNHRDVQDIVKAKYIEVVDPNGNKRVALDARGITLYGYESGSNGLNGTMIRLCEGNQVRVSLGLHEGEQAGLVTYSSTGDVRSYQLSAPDQTVMAIIGGEDHRTPKESLPGGFDGCAALRLGATAAKAQISISDSKKNTKILEIDAP